jgi:hypothetical protein
MARQAVLTLSEKNRLPSFDYSRVISSKPRGIETGVDLVPNPLGRATEIPGLVYAERRELVLVEAARNDGRSALRDALAGKQHRKNFRGRAGSMPEKEH